MNITVPDEVVEVGSPELEKSREMQLELGIIVIAPCSVAPKCGFMLEQNFSELTLDRMISALLQIAKEDSK